MCDNETDSFGPSTSSQRNKYLEFSKIHKDVASGYEVETKERKQFLEDLQKPFSLNWQRECLMREGRVSMVYYRSPPSMKNHCRRRRFRDKRKLKNYLSLTKSELSVSHFNFRPKIMDLEETWN